MFESDDVKGLVKRMAQAEKTLADVEARAEFLFDLMQTQTKKSKEDMREAEKQVEKLEARLKTVEQELAKLKKK